MNGIKVYVASVKPLKDTMRFEQLYSMVPLERRNKIDKLRLEKDKRLSLGSCLLLEKALSDWGINRYTLCYGPNGKPYIQAERRIFFNVSHSEERLLCAVSDEEVGCDVEKVRDISVKVAKRFFSPEEYAKIAEKETAEEQRDMFFRLWTLKESFMKVTGLGLKLPLDSFGIEMRGEEIRVRQAVDSGPYYFKEYHLDNEYKYAVCGRTPYFTAPEVVSFTI